MCISLLFAAYMIIYTSADGHILATSAQEKPHPRIRIFFSCQAPESESGIDH